MPALLSRLRRAGEAEANTKVAVFISYKKEEGRRKKEEGRRKKEEGIVTLFPGSALEYIPGGSASNAQCPMPNAQFPNKQRKI
ncbi:hypothetical protein QUB60_26340 [Microcoleus sp. A2-C5]|uniref:hypothetical protein n=1 Tax=unclassified Microcoleus TaxID=2642155 RepID=UPI002FD799A3